MTSSCRRAAEKQTLLLVDCTYSYGSSKYWDCRSRSSSLSCSWFSLVMNILCKGMALTSGLMLSPDFGYVLVLARDLGRALPPLFPLPPPSLSLSLPPPLPRPPSFPPARPPPRPLPGLEAEPRKQRGTTEMRVKEEIVKKSARRDDF